MIREKLLQALRDHAGAEYPKEACGLIVQVGHRQRYVPCRNDHHDPLHHFQICGADYAAAEDLGEVLAIVHSHPDGTSMPSVHDQVSCDAQGLPWYILSWPEGDLRRVEPRVGPRPLVGRPYVYGVQDCYSIIQDWYQEHRGVRLTRPDSRDGWWEAGDLELFLDNFESMGFRRTTEVSVGACFLMQVSAPAVNHCAVYVGDGQILHHMPGKLSGHSVYGGYWRERTRAIVEYIGS